MIEKIKKIIADMRLRYPRVVTVVVGIGATSIVVGIVAASFIDLRQTSSAGSLALAVDAGAQALIVGVVGEDGGAGAATNVNVNSSWPGEVISSAIAHIQPQREGVITDWYVGIGDSVYAGTVLGKISAPPATPELIAMLAEQTAMVTRTKALATAADAYAAKEQARFKVLSDASVLARLRDQVTTRRAAVRSFIEQMLTRHVTAVTSYFDWKSFRLGGLNRQYGNLNQNIQNAYEIALLTLATALKTSFDLPALFAQDYVALAVQLANQSSDAMFADAFRMAATEDQKDFLMLLADYNEALVMMSDKEIEITTMISEKSAMIEKDRLMAHAEADAAEGSYRTVANEITVGSSIIAPRSGTISAIYKKVGDLVGPEMPVAVIVGFGTSNHTVRVSIPSNVRKPAVGDVVAVSRPGFPDDAYPAKFVGVGVSLDDTGSYAADVVFTDLVDWPIGASVRVALSGDSQTRTVPLSSTWKDKQGNLSVWGVSEAGRIFARKITPGRTLGSLIEVYENLAKGDRYIVNPNVDIREDVFIDDMKFPAVKNGGVGTPKKSSGGHQNMSGMEM